MLPRALLPVLLVLAACGSGGSGTDRDRVVMLAASSLRDVLEVVEDDLERALREVDLDITTDGSSALAAAVIDGAPADLFVSADEMTMSRLVDAGRVDRQSPRLIARNSLVIAVAPGNPRGITGLDDLGGGLVVALCHTDVPCGAYAERAFARAGVAVPGAGREGSVAAVLAKVRLGEADAGIVYRSDLERPRGVEGVELPRAHNVEVRYHAAVLEGARNPRGAEQVLDHLVRTGTQLTLRTFGFGPA